MTCQQFIVVAILLAIPFVILMAYALFATWENSRELDRIIRGYHDRE